MGILLCIVAVFASLAYDVIASVATSSKPHIIMIVLDDIGYNDVGFNGGIIPTPFIDSLSSQGIRMDRYYTHTLCTPSRMALLTGCYSHVFGFGSGGVLIGAGAFSLPGNTSTIPKELAKRGYSSHAIGKWHLGSTRFKDIPTGTSWGFDSFVGVLHGAGGHYSKAVTAEGQGDAYYDYGRSWPNGTYALDQDDRHSTRSFSSEAVALLARHQATQPERPLFLYLAYTAAHTPLQADPDWLEHCTHIKHPYRRTYCGLVVGADEGIRNVTEAAMKYLGNNVIIMVTSDNGGMLHVGGLNAPLRGSKNSGYEGGVRTIGFWTDLTADHRYLPSALTYSGLIHIADWMPTLLSIVDGAVCASSAPVQQSSKEEWSGGARGCGYDQWCAIVNSGPSPRHDAVLVLDDFTNCVSYIRAPYKLMIGKLGDGEHSVEPTGRYVYNSPTFIQVLEEELKMLIDVAFGTRDFSFFWHEVLHVLIKKFTMYVSGSDFDFENAGELVLGSPSGGHVLNNTKVPVEAIPVRVFNVWEDPGEHVDLSLSHPEITRMLIESFDEHWRDHPPQFNARTACNERVRFAPGPKELCRRRTSDMFVPIEQRSAPKAMECVWEHPFIEDDDPEACGTGNLPPDNMEMFFQAIVVRKVKWGIAGLLISLLVLFLSIAVISRYFRPIW